MRPGPTGPGRFIIYSPKIKNLDFLLIMSTYLAVIESPTHANAERSRIILAIGNYTKFRLSQKGISLEELVTLDRNPFNDEKFPVSFKNMLSGMSEEEE